MRSSSKTGQESIAVNEVKLTYKRKVNVSELPKIISSKASEEYLRSVWDLDTIDLCESFYVIYLNRSNKVKCHLVASVGGVSGTVADIKIILATALKTLSSSIIVAHNHPSGNLKPSEADKQLTQKLKEACKLLEISLLDHLILTSEGYFSFADEGYL